MFGVKNPYWENVKISGWLILYNPLTKKWTVVEYIDYNRNIKIEHAVRFERLEDTFNYIQSTTT